MPSSGAYQKMTSSDSDALGWAQAWGTTQGAQFTLSWKPFTPKSADITIDGSVVDMSWKVTIRD